MCNCFHYDCRWYCLHDDPIVSVSSRMARQCSCRKELCHATIYFPFVNQGPVYSMLKEVRKEALQHLSLAFREFEQTLSWLPLRYFRSYRYLLVLSEIHVPYRNRQTQTDNNNTDKHYNTTAPTTNNNRTPQQGHRPIHNISRKCSTYYKPRCGTTHRGSVINSTLYHLPDANSSYALNRGCDNLQ